MPDITLNLGLKKPKGNEVVSRAAYNENLDILDQKAMKKGEGIANLAGGLLENLPTAGVAGRYYFAQDTGEIYLDTGTEWVLAAASNAALETHLSNYATFKGNVDKLRIEEGKLQFFIDNLWHDIGESKDELLQYVLSNITFIEDAQLAYILASNPVNSSFVAADNQEIMGLFLHVLLGSVFNDFKNYETIDDILDDSDAIDIILADSNIFQLVLESSYVMEKLVEKTSVLNQIMATMDYFSQMIDCQTSMEHIGLSKTALNLIVASDTHIDKINNNNNSINYLLNVSESKQITTTGTTLTEYSIFNNKALLLKFEITLSQAPTSGAWFIDKKSNYGNYYSEETKFNVSNKITKINLMYCNPLTLH